MSLFQAVAVLSIISCVSALIDGQRIVPAAAGKSPGFVKMPVHAKHTNATDPGAHKRQIDIGLADPFYGISYYVNLQLGTPPQPVVVVFDTGSDELWVNPDCSTAASAAQTTWCNSNPVYNPALSSTASYYGPLSPFDMQYGKGFAQGNYYLDTVVVGGINVPTSLFGVATTSSSMAAGIWGTCYGASLVTPYYTVLDLMVLDGIIQSTAFSLDLASVDSNEGAVVFGGIDTMRYTGALQKMPIIPYYNSPDGQARYWIYMSSFGVTRKGVSTTLSAPVYEQAVFLDSGGTLSYLPANIVTNLVSYFPEAVQSGSVFIVPCSLRDEASTLDFGFGSTIIRVPFHEAIWAASSTTCVLGVGSTTGVNWVLGDTMLRGAYVVYDQDNDNLHIAPAANCGSNIIPISSGVNAVPSVTGACKVASATASSSSKATSSSKVTTSSSSSKTSSISSTKVTTSSTSSKTSSISSSKVSTSSSSSSSSKASSTSSTKVATSSSSSKATSSSLSSKLSSFSSSSKITSSSSSVKPTSSSSSKSLSSSSSTKATSSPVQLSSSSSIKLSSTSSSSKASSTSSSKLPSSSSSSKSTSSSIQSSSSSGIKLVSTSSSGKTSSTSSSKLSSSSSASSSSQKSSSISSSSAKSSSSSSIKSSSTSAQATVTVTKTKTITYIPTGTCTAAGQVY